MKTFLSSSVLLVIAAVFYMIPLEYYVIGSESKKAKAFFKSTLIFVTISLSIACLILSTSKK